MTSFIMSSSLLNLDQCIFLLQNFYLTLAFVLSPEKSYCSIYFIVHIKHSGLFLSAPLPEFPMVLF